MVLAAILLVGVSGLPDVLVVELTGYPCCLLSLTVGLCLVFELQMISNSCNLRIKLSF